MARVLIAGCGQLGSRHLQAVAAVPGVREIEVVDPRAEGLELGRSRLAESGAAPRAAVRWLRSLEEASRGGELCIIATLAQERPGLVRAIAEIGYSAFVLEKLVAPSLEEFEALREFAAARGLSIWVNAQLRSMPLHRRLKARLEPGEPVIMEALGGNHGLATNGIHAADLFSFYSGSGRIEPAGSSIDERLHPSKRGNGLAELSGVLRGRAPNGSRLSVRYVADFPLYEQFVIATRSWRCLVDHIQEWAAESEAASGWAWRPVPFDGTLMVSRFMRSVAADILASNRCALPALEEHAAAHRFVLGELAPHFARLQRREEAACPVT
jgi:hypothetical protein